ncbi:pentatricopeptide repeat-containing protein [Tanacetum coccineum]
MREHGCAPDNVTYNTLLNALCKKGKLNEVRELLLDMKKQGLSSNRLTYNTLVHAYCLRKGCLSEASHVLELMKQNGILPDVWTYNPLNYGLCDEGKVEEAITGPTGRCLSGSTVVESGNRRYLSRKEIEEKSPSRSDDIDMKKETYLHKSYCTFLQDLRIRLKVRTKSCIRKRNPHTPVEWLNAQDKHVNEHAASMENCALNICLNSVEPAPIQGVGSEGVCIRLKRVAKTRPLHVGFTFDRGGNAIDVHRFTRKAVLHHLSMKAKEELHGKEGLQMPKFEASDLESFTGKYDTVVCLDVLIHYPQNKDDSMIAHLAYPLLKTV